MPGYFEEQVREAGRVAFDGSVETLAEYLAVTRAAAKWADRLNAAISDGIIRQGDIMDLPFSQEAADHLAAAVARQHADWRRLAVRECDGADCTEFEHRDGCRLYEAPERASWMNLDQIMDRIVGR